MSSRRLQNSIDSPTLELKIISAGDLSNIYVTDKLDAYAVVSMNGHTNQKKQSAKTPIDYDGGSYPTWNHTVKFSINEKAAREGSLTVQVKLYSYWLESEDDLYLGEVNVSVQDLLASNPFANGNVKKMKPMTYPVKFIGESEPNAKLSLSYRFNSVQVDDLYPPKQPESDSLPASSSQPIIYSPQVQPTGRTITLKKLALELLVLSAKNIRNVNVFDDMDVYASVSIHEGKTSVKHKVKTPIAYSGFKFPTWNYAVKFSFDEEEVGREDRFNLIVELKSHRPVMGDKHIGEIRVRIQELIGSNPPSPLFDAEPSRMKLVTRKVTGPNGEQGTLNFTYRFLKEQVTIPIVPEAVPQPFIMYIPVPHQSYGSAHGTSGYMAVHPAGNVEPSNGFVPIYMPPSYQPQPQPQPQLPPQNFQSQPQSQHHPQLQLYPQNSQFQHHPQLQLSPQNFQSQPQLQHQPQLQPPPQRPTQIQAQKQGGKTAAVLGQGATILGQVIGGTLLTAMMSDGGNTQEVESSGLSFFACDQTLM